MLSPKTTAILLLSALLPLLDSSLVNVLLPSIGADLGASESQMQPAISGFMLAATAGIVLSTTFLRRFGAYRVWVAALVVFALSSLAVGASTTVPLLIAARVVQGAACGFIMPAVQQIAAEIVGRENMRAALATIGLPAVIAPAFGPLLGGVLVDVVGWRSLFYINVPVAALALALAVRTLPRTPGVRVPLGIGQAIPALLGMVGLLWALIYPTSLSWGIAAVAVCAIAAFCFMDLRAEAPLLHVSLYRNGLFAAVMALCLIVGAVFYGTLLSTSLHIQHDLGQAAWVAGVALGVQGGGAWAVRSLLKGPWKEANAFLLIAVGLAVAGLGTLGVQSTSSWPVILLCSLIRGLGLGACTLLALSAAYEVVDDSQTSAVGAHTRLMLQLGGAFGTALVGVWAGSALGLGIGVAGVALVAAVVAGMVLLRSSEREK